jgi:hypothetical protein
MQSATDITIQNLSNNSLNISSEELKQNVNLTHFIISIFLSFFCVITVFGNALVIYAVVQERYLKSGMEIDYIYSEFFSEGHDSS